MRTDLELYIAVGEHLGDRIRTEQARLHLVADFTEARILDIGKSANGVVEIIAASVLTTNGFINQSLALITESCKVNDDRNIHDHVTMENHFTRSDTKGAIDSGPKSMLNRGESIVHDSIGSLKCFLLVGILFLNCFRHCISRTGLWIIIIY